MGNVTITPSTNTAELSTSIDTTGLDTFVTAEVSTQPDLSDATEYFLYSGTNGGEHKATLRNLIPRVVYYVRVTATNDSGTVRSTVKTFSAVTPIGVVINDDTESSQSPKVVLTFTTPSRTTAIRISNYADFSRARVIPATTHIDWQLLEPTESTSTRTVWVQFITLEGAVKEFSDSIDIVTDVPDSISTTGAANARSFSTSQPLVVARSVAPVRSATIMSRQKQSKVVRIQTKIGKKIFTRTVAAKKSGKYVIVFPKGIKSLNVRFVSPSGSVTAWSHIAAL